MNIKKLFASIITALLFIPLTTIAEDIERTYTGEYSLDYLLRNYNVVTFGQKENLHLDYVTEDNITFQKGMLNIAAEGPVMINGNYKSNEALLYSVTNPTNAISYIKGTKSTNVTSESITVQNSNFIDVNKLYKQILAESNSLVNMTEHHINSKYMEIDKPGIYQINSTRINIHNWNRTNENFATTYNYLTGFTKTVKYVYIDNYDPNSYYIFNNLKLYEYDNYMVLIKKSDDEIFEPLEYYALTEEYTGNIIFNFPNAKMVEVDAYSGKIIAPQADIILSNASLYNRTSGYTHLDIDIEYHDSIYANSINGDADSYISYKPYTSTKKITTNATPIEAVKDYTDDLYTGTYSIEEMLKNYNVVALNGNVDIFHIVGQFLINGELRAGRLDLESNRIHESSINYYVNNDGYDWESAPGGSYKRWGDGDCNIGTNSNVYISATWSSVNGRDIYNEKKFINFERLYDTITKEQKNIKKGTEVKGTDGVAKIKVGGNYYINDINDIEEIIFEDFDKNNSKMTVITILDSSDVNFPRVSQTTSNNPVPTKDYFGKAEPMFSYEYFNFPKDNYYGNIIWNLPNATYVKLAENAPFFGHLIAPNADVGSYETHFSGCFIVKSLVAEGYSEAHFFPLQAINPSEDFDGQSELIEFAEWGYGELSSDKNQTQETTPEKNPNTATGAAKLFLLAFIIINIIIIKKRNKQRYISD